MSSLRVSDQTSRIHSPTWSGSKAERPLHILMSSDAWFPQVNGVVRSINQVKMELESRGHILEMLTPDQFFSFPCPSYPEISLAVGASFRVRRRVQQRDYDAVHVATEGPLGLAMRRSCIKEGIPFTTAFHTKFPEYIEARWRIPLRYTNPIQKWFHSPAENIMVSSPGFARVLQKKGYDKLKLWSRGVNTEMFHPRYCEKLYDEAMFLYVGRVAVEKNVEAFLKLDLPGKKVVVGDGPQAPALKKLYPEADFVGFKKGEALAKYYASADVFVFPSLTDTFGNVMLEALSCGTPVAAFDVTGPKDVIGPAGPGVMDSDLRKACLQALDISSKACRKHALQYSWSKSADQFLSNLALIR